MDKDFNNTAILLRKAYARAYENRKKTLFYDPKTQTQKLKPSKTPRNSEGSGGSGKQQNADPIVICKAVTMNGIPCKFKVKQNDAINLYMLLNIYTLLDCIR